MSTHIIRLDDPVSAARGVQVILQDIWNLCHKSGDTEGMACVEVAMSSLGALSSREVRLPKDVTSEDSP